MSHHVYTTKGLVLRLSPVRETDLAVTLMTRDLGLVTAQARGVRRTASKLSGSLLELALIRVSLVRGRHSWRLTTATLLIDPARELRAERLALGAYARTLALLKRLVRGEERHKELFDGLESSLRALCYEVGPEDADAWELYAVARILFHLGYLSQEALPANILETRDKRRTLLALVNAGIRESGL